MIEINSLSFKKYQVFRYLRRRKWLINFLISRIKFNEKNSSENITFKKEEVKWKLRSRSFVEDRRVLHSNTHKESARFRNCRVQNGKRKKKKRKEKIISHLLFFSRGRERPTKRKRGGREEGEKQDGDENRYLHNETPINQSIHGRRESLSETSTGINRRGRWNVISFRDSFRSFLRRIHANWPLEIRPVEYSANGHKWGEKWRRHRQKWNGNVTRYR